MDKKPIKIGSLPKEQQALVQDIMTSHKADAVLLCTDGTVFLTEDREAAAKHLSALAADGKPAEIHLVVRSTAN